MIKDELLILDEIVIAVYLIESITKAADGSSVLTYRDSVYQVRKTLALKQSFDSIISEMKANAD